MAQNWYDDLKSRSTFAMRMCPRCRQWVPVANYCKECKYHFKDSLGSIKRAFGLEMCPWCGTYGSEGKACRKCGKTVELVFEEMPAIMCGSLFCKEIVAAGNYCGECGINMV